MAGKRVLIADDHPLYCEALRAVVPQACPDAEISEAGSQAAVLAAVQGAPFDLVLLDLNIPGATGLSCLAALRQAAPHTPVVVVSAVEDARTMQEVILGGANAFVPKSAPRELLMSTIRAVLAGGTYLPPEVIDALREARARPREEGGGEELTLRQRRVLELLAQGLSNKQIARTLEISEITVKAHVSSIFRKLGVANRVQAVLEAGRLLGRPAH